MNVGKGAAFMFHIAYVLNRGPLYLKGITNPRHSMQTRFLYTCISSVLFAGEETLNELNAAFAEDARKLFEDGVLATCPH